LRSSRSFVDAEFLHRPLLEGCGLARMRVEPEGAVGGLERPLRQVELLELEAPEPQPRLGIARMLDHRSLERAVGSLVAALREQDRCLGEERLG
jgi:hypothetical protein